MSERGAWRTVRVVAQTSGAGGSGVAAAGMKDSVFKSLDAFGDVLGCFVEFEESFFYFTHVGFQRCHPGKAAVPEAKPSGRDFSAPPHPLAVSAEPYQRALPERPRGSPGTMWDVHRSMLSAVVCRRSHQAPRRTTRRNRVPTSWGVLSEASANSGAWPSDEAET